MQEKYEKFLKKIAEINDLGYAQELLMWDQETYLPPKGTQMRARVQGTLSGLIHEDLTSPEFVALVQELKEAQLPGDQGLNVKEIDKSQQRAMKIPRDLVVELSDTQSQAYKAWVEARQKSDFSLFCPWLKKILELKKRVAYLVGFEGSIYNAFFKAYEEDTTVEEIIPVFENLRQSLVPFIEKIVSSNKVMTNGFVKEEYPVDKQEIFNRRVLKDMGFDLDAGRLDIAVHPFCAGFTKYDVRLTTRYENEVWPEPLLSTLHEGGHGLYEQGLPEEGIGTPIGQSMSPGVHESQSRLWENLVGRSKEFWYHYLPIAKEYFGDKLKNIDVEKLYEAINQVRPSLIRVESDEVTYNLHILIRFELEREMMEGKIQVEDLPKLWNERMKKYLGVVPSSDATGVLQDVHWSFGLIAYFPTYTIGNLYSAQFFHQAEKDIPDLKSKISQGDLLVLRKWLLEKIHSRGKRLTPKGLIQEVTGEPLKADYFVQYLKDKFSPIYGI
ncbi:MAG: carboxypeptidase M32 [Candidatus Brocadiae bacterium]|nr:carboxypeptidase M32 [Candidatus Brocadiia bacterium]